MEEINNIEGVRKVIGQANSVTSKKIYSFINDRMANFISSSPIMMLSTVDSDGFPTISPKGDKPGFVQVTDSYTLLIPELRGNKLAFSLENIVQQNKVALIFLVPGTVESLRVHGYCRLLKDNEICESLASQSHHALLVMEIKVTKAYFHCGKAFLRSKTWQPTTWKDKMKISFGQEIAENIDENSNFIEAMDAGVEERYLTEL